MYEDESDDSLPPLYPAGVSPGWRAAAIVIVLFAAVLLAMVVVLFMSLVGKSAQQFNNAWAMAAPPVAVAGAAADPAEDVLDPINPAFPLRQDLRPPGTFPLAGDPEADPEDPPRSPRQEFRALAERPAAWSSPGPDLPERVLVSFDGAHMAYTAPDGLWVGPVGAPNPVEQDVPQGVGPPGPRMRGGMMFAPGQPPRPRAANGTRPTLSGWSPEGLLVSWVGENGWAWQHDMQAKLTTRHDFKADAVLPNADRLVVVSREPHPKLDGAADADRDRTTVKVLAGVNQAPTLLIDADPSRWESPGLSPDGKQLAIVSDRGEKPGRRRVFVLPLDGNAAKAEPVSPPADRIEGVCWTPEGKELIYARSQSPRPADHSPGTAKDACDLFLLDLATKKETRVSRGGGFTSPSVTKDGDLYYLTIFRPANGAPTVQLLKVTLKAARDWAEAQEKAAREKGKEWKELAGAVLKQAGEPKKVADTFARAYKEKFNADPPATADALEWQRREVAGLDLTPDDLEGLALLLGAVEGDYLRGRQKGSEWHTARKDGLGGPVAAENSFGYAFNPFRPLRAPEKADKDESPQSLAEVLYRAEGRPIVLATDAASAKEALAKLVDPDLARGGALLGLGKGDEADDVLLKMTERHVGNQYLLIEVGALLHRHGRARALARLVEPLLKNLDAGGLALARDPRLYNLLGVAALETDPNRAFRAFQDALRCDLNYGPAYLNLALAYQKASRTNDARLCLRRYLNLFPEGEGADEARRRLAAAGDG
jgi:hypothetical protein